MPVPAAKPVAPVMSTSLRQVTVPLLVASPITIVAAPPSRSWPAAMRRLLTIVSVAP